MPAPLSLHEEVLLLSLRDREGTIGFGVSYRFAMGGAVLAELILGERVAVEAEGKKKFLRVSHSRGLGDPILDECLEKVAAAKRRAQLQTWVTRFANLKQLKDTTARELCRKGILRADEDKVLLLFKRRIYPELDPRPEREIMQRLEKAIFTETPDISPRTVVLLSLAKTADVLRVNFDKKRLEARKQRLERIVNGEIVGQATKDSIEAVQAAIMTAVIASSVATTVVTSSH